MYSKKKLKIEQDLRIKKVKISTSSKIREYEIQNLNYEQDSRMTKCLDLTAKESKIHLQHPNQH